MAKTTTARDGAAEKTAGARDGRAETVRDDTAPGEGPVIISATEARASEPVLADEEALASDTPPPASNPPARGAGAAADVRRERAPDHDRPTSGAGDYVGEPHAPTAMHGEPEFNRAAHVPDPDATTDDGIRYRDVANPRSEMERLEKREIELGAEMDYGEHRRTYQMFMNATKYGTALVIAVLVAMAFGFFIAGGLLGGLVVFAGAALASIWFLRGDQ